MFQTVIQTKNLAAESRVRLLLLNANPETHYNKHVLLITERYLLLTVRINIFILQLQPKTKGEFRFPVFVHWHHKQVTFITSFVSGYHADTPITIKAEASSKADSHSH